MKKIIAAILAVCAVFCVSLAAVSCDGNDAVSDTTTTAKAETTTAVSNKVTYKVKVVDENGNAVEGAYVQLCEATEDGRCFMPVVSDANGEATMELEEGAYKAKISMADGYTFADEYTNFGNEKTVTITVTAAQ